MSIRSRSANYFVAAIASALISFISLPLTTRFLGPTDFGLVALVSGTTLIGSGLATLGANYMINRHFATLDLPQKTAMLSTLAAMGFVIAATWAAALTGAFLLFRDDVSGIDAVPVAGFLLAVATLVISPLWGVALEVMTLEGKAGLYATASVIQSLAGASATLIALYFFDAGVVSLFLGAFVGTAVTFVTAVIALRNYLRPRVERHWLEQLKKIAFNNLVASMAEQGYIVMERWTLTRAAGLHSLGLYTHSQRYREIAMMGVKSVARGAWPVTLGEARDKSSTFWTTGRVWKAMHLILTLGGLAFAAFGDYVVAALTHDKFTEAALYVGPWFIMLLVQNAAKAQSATMVAFSEGRDVANVNTISIGVAAITLLVVVPMFGAMGAVVAMITWQLVYRLLATAQARRAREVPFQDGMVLLGSALIVISVSTKEWVIESPGEATLLFIVTASVAVFAAWSSLTDVFRILVPRSIPADEVPQVTEGK